MWQNVHWYAKLIRSNTCIRFRSLPTRDCAGSPNNLVPWCLKLHIRERANTSCGRHPSGKSKTFQFIFITISVFLPFSLSLLSSFLAPACVMCVFWLRTRMMRVLRRTSYSEFEVKLLNWIVGIEDHVRDGSTSNDSDVSASARNSSWTLTAAQDWDSATGYAIRRCVSFQMVENELFGIVAVKDVGYLMKNVHKSVL